MAGVTLQGIAPGRRPRRILRWPAVAAAVLSVALVGAALERVSRHAPPPAAGAGEGLDAPPGVIPGAPPATAAAAEDAPHADQGGGPHGEARRAADPAWEHAVAKHFERGVALLHAGQPEYAAVAFHEVLRLAPRLPEAHVNMGFALLAQDRPGPARDFFLAASELRREQVNAYYGLAMASEALGDMPTALGAMRTYVHLAPADDPFVRKARAALWEWQAASAATPPAQGPAVEAPQGGAGARGPSR